MPQIFTQIFVDVEIVVFVGVAAGIGAEDVVVEGAELGDGV